MPNKIRGEGSLIIGGKVYKACATLNALAEIEEALGLASLEELGERLSKPKAKEIRAVVGALLRGGGNEITDEEAGNFDMSQFDQITDVINGGAPDIDDGEDEDTPEDPPKKPKTRKKKASSGRK
jgi:tail tube GTA-gp10-like protein